PTCRGPLFFGQATRGPPLLRPRTCLRPRCLTTPGFLGPPSSAHPVLDVEEYVDANSPAFAALCYDGSHPLEWTALHEGYRDLFERQFCAVLEGQEVEREEFLEWITALQEASEALDPEAELPGSGGLRAVDLGGFLSALTASEDYESFLRVMFRAVAERRRRSAPAPPPGEHAGEGTPAAARALGGPRRALGAARWARPGGRCSAGPRPPRGATRPTSLLSSAHRARCTARRVSARRRP
ncbi:unnamed protein product, partial [Prorocentrum cordatum]